jgi:hypothetical protein
MDKADVDRQAEDEEQMDAPVEGEGHASSATRRPAPCRHSEGPAEAEGCKEAVHPPPPGLEEGQQGQQRRTKNPKTGGTTWIRFSCRGIGTTAHPSVCFSLPGARPPQGSRTASTAGPPGPGGEDNPLLRRHGTPPPPCGGWG